MRSGLLGGLEPRERRTIVAGLVVSLAALGVAYGVVPLARRWSAREALISARAERLARLEGLVAQEVVLREALTEAERRLDEAPRRVLRERTTAVAASALQALLQGYAEESGILVNRLDVAGEPDTVAGGGTAIPATVSAIGDIHGMADLLLRVEGGRVALQVRELSITPNPALKGELLQLSLTLAAPVVTP